MASAAALTFFDCPSLSFPRRASPFAPGASSSTAPDLATLTIEAPLPSHAYAASSLRRRVSWFDPSVTLRVARPSDPKAMSRFASSSQNARIS